MIDGCGFKRFPDIDADKVAGWLSDRRAANLSTRSSNFYLSRIKSFCRWLLRSGRSPDNPLTHLEGVNPEVDVRRNRRALKPEELAALIEKTPEGPPFRRITGRDRCILYLVASYTGLRASELASLSTGSFELEGNPATVTVEAGYLLLEAPAAGCASASS